MRGEVRIDRRPGAHALNIMGDAHRLPFRDKVFDYTICYSVLEHLESPYKGLLEMKRVTKSKLHIKIPNVYYFKRILRALVNPYYKTRFGVLHLQAWDLLAFKRLLKIINNLEIIKLEWVDFVFNFKFFGVLIKWPSLLLGWNMLVTMKIEENRPLEVTTNG